MKPLRFVTVQAANTLQVSAALAEWLTVTGPVPVEFEQRDDWRGAYRQIRRGDIELAWLCGRPYVEIVDQPRPPVELLVAPVMNGRRYADRPVYYSDVIVRADSSYRTFADLRGTRWAFNEPGSQSGYHVTCHRLATLGETGQFFGEIREAGSHVASVAAVLGGGVDGAAIDSTLLSWMTDRDPSLREQLRIIDTFGPSPIPPIVVAVTVEQGVRAQLRSLLCAMHERASGQTVLSVGDVKRFVAVTDGDYDPIRRMAAASRHISLLGDQTG